MLTKEARKENFYTKFKKLGFDSVFDILSFTKSTFIQDYDKQLQGEAEQVYEWALFFANYIGHQYRADSPLSQPAKGVRSDSNQKKALTAEVNADEQTATLRKEEKTTYKNLFPEDDKTLFCDPNAIKAQTSPLAYLVSLYAFTKKLAQNGEDAENIIKALFEQRRPDIEDLCLSEKNTNQPVPGLDIVNRILEKNIEKNLCTEQAEFYSTLDTYLTYAVYPFELPFDESYILTLKKLKEKNLDLGTIIQQVDKKYPYFIYSLDLNFFDFTKKSMEAMALWAYSLLTPTQVAAITSMVIVRDRWIFAPHYSIVDSYLVAAYLLEYYGLFSIETPSIKAILAKLRNGKELTEAQKTTLASTLAPIMAFVANVPNFLKQTALTREGLNQLFSLQQYWPEKSVHFIKDSQGNKMKAPTPEEYGSSYINGDVNALINSEDGSFAPYLRCQKDGDIETITFTNTTRFIAINRFIRLLRATGVKQEALDWLIFASQNSDITAATQKRLDVSIIKDAIPALGFFRYLQNSYTLSLEEFTALIFKLSPYSIGDEISQFDQIFNADPNQPPLRLDNSSFDPNAENLSEETQRTIQQLAAGLNISSQDVLLLATQIKSYTPDQQLKLNVEIISYFYSLAKWSKLLNFTVGDICLLKNLLNSKVNTSPYVVRQPKQTKSSGSLLGGIFIVKATIYKESEEEILCVSVENNSRTNDICKHHASSTSSCGTLDITSTPEAFSSSDAKGLVIYLKYKLSTLGETIVKDGLQLECTWTTSVSISPAPKASVTVNLDMATPIKPSLYEAVRFEQAAVWLKKQQLTPTQLALLLGAGFTASVVATPQALNLFNDLREVLLLTDETEAVKTANKRLSESLVKLYQVAPTLAPNLVAWLGNYTVNEKDQAFAISMLETVQALKAKVNDQRSLQTEGTDFLKQVYRLERYVAAANFLKLTNTELQLLQAHPEYFAVDKGKLATLNLKLFYLLTRLKDWLAYSEEPEEKLLSYFEFAYTVPVRQQDCIDLLAESLHWDPNEVKFLFSKFNNTDKVAKTMVGIDWIFRIRVLCEQSGLSASELLALTPFDTLNEPNER